MPKQSKKRKMSKLFKNKNLVPFPSRICEPHKKVDEHLVKAIVPRAWHVQSRVEEGSQTKIFIKIPETHTHESLKMYSKIANPPLFVAERIRNPLKIARNGRQHRVIWGRCCWRGGRCGRRIRSANTTIMDPALVCMWASWCIRQIKIANIFESTLRHCRLKRL